MKLFKYYQLELYPGCPGLSMNNGSGLPVIVTEGRLDKVLIPETLYPAGGNWMYVEISFHNVS